MLAAQEVAEGALLLQVPEKLMLSASTALSSKHCGKLVRVAELSEWQALVLHLLCERAAGADSFWEPYISCLGDQATHPLLWGEALQQQLAGSSMLRMLTTRLQQVQEDTELLVAAGANDLPLAQAWQQQHGSPLVTVSSVCWAAAVLLSRTFSLDLSEPELPTLADMSYFGSWQAHGPACLVLVPWADMCQHSSDAGAEAMLLFDPESRVALLSADRAYGPGAEVYDSHGPGLSWSDLVMDHGCVVEGQDDHPRYDAVVTEHLQPRSSRNKALLEALTTLTGNPPIVSLTPSGPDPMGLAVLRAGLGSDAELVQAGWRTGSSAADVSLCARVMGRLGQPRSVATEQKVLAVLQTVVEGCLGAYPSTLQQDEAELGQLLEQQQQQGAGGQAAMQQQIRTAMLKGLISEKAALIGTQEVLSDWQQQLVGLKAKGAAAVKPEQIAAIYAEPDPDSDS